MFKTIVKLLLIIPVVYAAQVAAAQAGDANTVTSAMPLIKPVVAQLDKPTWISLYQPTYLFPFYYTDSPYGSVYNNNTPNQQRIKKLEVNFQISLKVPLWRDFINPNSTLYMAYTQLSFWQAYNNSPFFRETNYQPELFVENKLNIPLFSNWQFKFLNVGVAHQSNGRGGDLERSWNRVYANGIFANENWLVSIMPWYALHDASMEDHNRDIGNYLGYGRELVTYKYGNQEFSLQLQNVLESNFSRGAVKANWSFPLNKHLKGYVQWFSGYGQSLIEYNHYTNSAGIGIALNDWV